MQPLIKIQSIPIKIEAQTKRASLQVSNNPEPVRQQRSGAKQPVQRRPEQQTPDPRENTNRTARQAEQAEPANTYFQDATKAVQSYKQNGPEVGDVPTTEFIPAPSVKSEYQAPAANVQVPQSAPSSSFNYHMDRSTFDWNSTSKPQLEYVPASIEYSVTQYPEVVIEYVGEPIYVPASANPNYVPPPEAKNP